MCAECNTGSCGRDRAHGRVGLEKCRTGGVTRLYRQGQELPLIAMLIRGYILRECGVQAIELESKQLGLRPTRMPHRVRRVGCAPGTCESMEGLQRVEREGRIDSDQEQIG